jgi:hypothetical protein
MDIKSAKIQLVLSDPRLFSSMSNNLGLPDEYSRILTFTETDTRIRTSSTATATHEYEYSQFANGLARIFVILATRATLYDWAVIAIRSLGQCYRREASSEREATDSKMVDRGTSADSNACDQLSRRPIRCLNFAFRVCVCGLVAWCCRFSQIHNPRLPLTHPLTWT